MNPNHRIWEWYKKDMIEGYLELSDNLTISDTYKPKTLQEAIDDFKHSSKNWINNNVDEYCIAYCRVDKKERTGYILRLLSFKEAERLLKLVEL